MAEKKKTDTLHIRIEKEVLRMFRHKSKVDYGKDPNDFIREILKAAVEGRLKIIQSEKQLNRKELYDES